jgi:glycosyltransferase involved in cell wall biosynthesis
MARGSDRAAETVVPRRLLIVADTLAGGLGEAAAAHRDWFAGRGWEVRVAAPVGEPGAVTVGDHVPVDLPVTARDLRGQWRAGGQIRALAHEFEPDIVHCHGARCFAATRLRIGGVSRDPRRVPWVTLHGSPDMTFDPRGYAIVRRLGVATIPKLAGRAVSVAPDVPDGWLFAPSASRRLRQWDRLGPSTAEVPTFLWLGRLGEPKQPEVFVRALASLAARVPSAVGLMAGIGPLASAVESLIASTGARFRAGSSPATSRFCCDR